MKKKDIMAIVAAAVMAGGCSSKDEMQTQNELVPIRLTASVGMEAVTRGADGKVIETDAVITRGIQENAIASGEKVYVWANEAGGSSWDYLKAWTLTADGSTGLSGSTKYYPPDGTTITMNAVHGNFSTEPSEDNTAIGTLTHSVVADQSAAGDYEKSDLLFGTATGSKASTSAENIDFTHMLSKIEVNLTAGYGYDATDLETAEVHLNNVLPTVTIDPTDGSLGSASGTATTITPRKDATTGAFEAVIPPQTFANPDALIAVTTTKEGLTLTSTVPNDVTTYASDTRYVYNVTCSKTNKRLNPLWYVAENNVQSYNSATNMVTLETDPATAGASQVYSWDDAMAFFAKQSSTYDEYWAGDIYDGITDFKYHLPSEKEWFSIVPAHYHGDPSDAENIFVDNAYFVQEGSYTEPECIFGYNAETKVASSYKSYWSRYTTTNVRYALRFLGTPYCSVWKYEWSNSVLTITAKLIGYLAADTDDATLSSLLSTYMAKSDSWWNSNDENEGAIQRKFYSVGLNTAGTASLPNSNANNVGYYWSTKEANSTAADYLQSGSGRLYNIAAIKTYGLSVRLFRSEGPAAARTDPGVLLRDSEEGYIVGSNGRAYPLSYKNNLPTGVTAVGVVIKKSDNIGWVVSLFNVGGSANSDGTTYTWSNKANNLNSVGTISGYTWEVITHSFATSIGGASNWSTYNNYITNAGGRSMGTTLYYWEAAGGGDPNYAYRIQNGSVSAATINNTYYVRPFFPFSY